MTMTTTTTTMMKSMALPVLLLLQCAWMADSSPACIAPYPHTQCRKKTRGLRRGHTGGNRMLMPGENDADECITFSLCTQGNEYDHWTDDCHGHTLVLDKDDEYAVAELAADGTLVASNIKFRGQTLPSTLPHRLRPTTVVDCSHRMCSESQQMKYLQQISPECQDDNHENCEVVVRRKLREHIQHEHRRTTATKGTVKNLVVPFRFSDHAGRALPSKEDIELLMNGDDNECAGTDICGLSGSVQKYYLTNSRGQLTIESVVVDWVDITMDEATAANGTSAADNAFKFAVKEALVTLEDRLDANAPAFFSQFDGDGDGEIDFITFLHSGYGADFNSGNDLDQYGQHKDNRIWSHQGWLSNIGSWNSSSTGMIVDKYMTTSALWGASGTEICRIGVIAHELGHFMKNAGDLYDTDGGGWGIGALDGMGYSWGFDNSQHYPPLFGPYSQAKVNWAAPFEITQSGTYRVKRIDTMPSSADDQYLYTIKQGFRDGESIDIAHYMHLGTANNLCPDNPSSGETECQGLTILHVDKSVGNNNREGHPGQSGWPSNGNHYRVALLPADGSYDLETNANVGKYSHFFKVDATIGPSNPGSPQYPNTDSYAGGLIVPTEIEITVKADPDPDYMKIEVTMPNVADLRISTFTDTYPGETYWSIEKNDGSKVAERTRFVPTSNHVDNIQLLDGDYTVKITDSYSDGICCSYGEGSFKVTVSGQELTVLEASDFGDMAVQSFTVSGGIVSLPSQPTAGPTAPSPSPIDSPSAFPSTISSASPSVAPSQGPSASPTKSAMPSSTPSASPSKSAVPSHSPSASPSVLPSDSPSAQPSLSPTDPPVTDVPSLSPSASPSSAPSTASPSASPSSEPTKSPSASPSSEPTKSPSASPSSGPTTSPSNSPSSGPTASSSASPSSGPTTSPSASPSSGPTTYPTTSPSSRPTESPTASPSSGPTSQPTRAPTPFPTDAQPQCALYGESCSVDGDCCNRKCKGKRNRRKCK